MAQGCHELLVAKLAIMVSNSKFEKKMDKTKAMKVKCIVVALFLLVGG